MSKKLMRVVAIVLALSVVAAACGSDSADLADDVSDATDGDTLTGPGGWTVDLSTCPDDWSDTAGIVDGQINLGLSIAQSGPLTAFGNIASGMDAYFDYVNEHGGIGADGLQINLTTKDDAYVATQTQEIVAELLQSENPFYITVLGSPNTFATQGTLNDACVPQPMVMTGHQAWGDPDNYPWTTGEGC